MLASILAPRPCFKRALTSVARPIWAQRFTHSPVLPCGHLRSVAGIYFVPNGQATQGTWHYIDCNDGAVIGYGHGTTSAASSAYFGGTFSPSQNSKNLETPLARNPPLSLSCSLTVKLLSFFERALTSADRPIRAHRLAHSPVLHCGRPRSLAGIYFAPFGQATESTWHYIDCDNGTVIQYEHGSTLSSFGYTDAMYSPTENSKDLEPPLARNPRPSPTCSY